MKKYSKLLMAVLLVMAMFVFAGCSEAGSGYFNSAKDVIEMNHYAYDGQMKMSMDLGGLAGDPSDAEMAEINNMLQNIDVTFTGQYDSKVGAYYMDMQMKMGNYNVPMEMYICGDKMLVSADSILDMIKSLNADQAELDATKAALGSVKWLDFADAESSLGNALQGMDFVKMNQSIYAVLTYFSEHSFKNLDLGCFSGDAAKGYTLTIDDSNANSVIKGLVTFVADNSEAICRDIDAQKSVLDGGLLASYGMDSAALKDTVKEVAKYKGAEDLNNSISEITNMIKGTQFKSNIKKTADKKYTEKDKANITLDVEGTKIAVKFDSVVNYDGTKAVEVNVPKDGVETIANIAKKLQPKLIDATLYMKDNQIWLIKNYPASLFNSIDFIESQAIVKDDYNYFPMRQIAEMFGETVEWDAKAHKAYVVRGSEKIDMSGFIKNDRTYIKLRDFEKLGYMIDYTYDSDLGGIATINYEIK